MTTFEMLARLATGVVLGVAIGLERQYRARMAGLRTNALVCAGATLFVLLSAHGFHGGTADPTRVAAQIVSGIGFLGAGVIMREGASVRGLNTAATLWCSAAIGALAGAGMYGTAAAGTVAVGGGKTPPGRGRGAGGPPPPARRGCARPGPPAGRAAAPPPGPPRTRRGAPRPGSRTRRSPAAVRGSRRRSWATPRAAPANSA
ncbi:MgtC/SapB family protein, partial [Nocardia wallacei]|uniref:MgtC/SapB family protein n=1 Tax=Nocardia wallacei TaxID=480035 RepID=UPI0024579E70